MYPVTTNFSFPQKYFHDTTMSSSVNTSSPNQPHEKIRLVNGRSLSQGELQLWLANQWRSVCSQNNQDAFEVKTGVGHGCLLSLIILMNAVDSITCHNVNSEKTGICRTGKTTIEDLDFADDLCLMLYKSQDPQARTNKLAAEEAAGINKTSSEHGEDRVDVNN
ncbi:unnamed protein product [Trichobilharzia regenti]|nr:unnamed protein product [Trichobilharzia regenti]